LALAGPLHIAAAVNKRLLLASLCDKMGATDLVLALRRRTRSPWLPVLTFHRIARIRPEDPFDRGVVDSTPAELEQQIAMLATHFNPIGLDDVTRFLAGKPLPRSPVLVTFDDGYRDNHDVALPILRRHKIPAVFFIATEYISRRRLFWWDRISYLVKSSPLRRLALTYPMSIALDLVTPGAREQAARWLSRVVKTTFALDLDRFLGELARAAHVELTDEQERRYVDQLVMTWAHVRALRAAGMSVQSHTRTHRVLQTLTADQVDGEVRGARDDLERELDERVYAISYPAGHAIGGRTDLRRALRDAGYTIGFTNATGSQPVWRRVDPYDVHRMALDPHTPPALLGARLAAPPVFD
jgi:peptidoglycan/xylan/chitin deacetylase (PgdA/CDA1 family)